MIKYSDDSHLVKVGSSTVTSERDMRVCCEKTAQLSRNSGELVCQCGNQLAVIKQD